MGGARMDHAQGIAAARKLSTRSEADQWELARLTYEHTTGEDAMTLTAWAEALGWSTTHAHYLRRTWTLFRSFQSTENAADRTFNECYVVAMRARDGEGRTAKEPRSRDPEPAGRERDRARDPMD